jgi:hypothetical protein
VNPFEQTPAERLAELVGKLRAQDSPRQYDLQSAVLNMANLGRNALALKIHVDPQVLSRTLTGDLPGLHVRRGLEQELGLPAYELDKYLGKEGG